MYIPFDALSDQAHIWIYQAHRQLMPEEQEAILHKAKAFLAAWTSHGRPLQCGAKIFYDRLLGFSIAKTRKRS